ncbi:hypothetical protein CWB96_13040 [Pseudoalteromonas citrea]|uniref:Uncharacterized protein n=1 Tax=Pseudoalteromonas citrea TaxID=43655 RepID=A0A5S3XMY9_9GAMM|nr:hypothetical protein [Pseudoalteromonas citrea]TMP38783.1 hypothetical protein CWB97_21660 [Pseudoalteromonas citrea]TMP57747.1 hypothetical protein CWB96_13040 [Pseudoalteromonas citrea]
MTQYQIQQFSKIKGEQRTRALLVDRFLVDKPEYDLVGGDFVIGEIPKSGEEWHERVSMGEARGLVQSKYVQDEKTAHYIEKTYVVDKKGNPRKNFFLFIHATTGEGEHKRYFFTSREITDNLDEKARGYYFRIGKEDRHKIFSTLTNKEILDKIHKTYQGGDVEETQEFVARAFSEITLEEFYRVEGNLPNYIKIEGILSELGGGSWEGLSFRNRVLTEAGWDVNRNYGESPEEARKVFDRINRCIPKIKGFTMKQKQKSILELVSSDYI